MLKILLKSCALGLKKFTVIVFLYLKNSLESSNLSLVRNEKWQRMFFYRSKKTHIHTIPTTIKIDFDYDNCKPYISADVILYILCNRCLIFLLYLQCCHWCSQRKVDGRMSLIFQRVNWLILHTF